jgi:hypothetical protein
MNLLDLHFKHVARRGALDRHGASEDVQSKLRRQSLEDARMFGEDGIWAIFKDFRAAGNRVDRDRVAGAHSADRGQLSIEETPMDGFRGGGKMMVRAGHCRDLSAR